MIPIILLISLKISSSALLSPSIQMHTTDIQTLLLNDVFVDKTYLISDFEFDIPDDFEEPELKLILAPPGWGKSTNLNMFEKYYEIEVDDQGNSLARNQTINHKLFLGGEIEIGPNQTKILEPLQISQHLDTLEHLGKYPVITLELKNTSGDTYDEIEQQIKSRVMETYKTHNYLLLSPNISEPDKIKLQNYSNGQITKPDLIFSLGYLSEKLNEHFRRHVIILIDDYDVPVINAYLKFGNKSTEFEKLTELIRKIVTFPVRDPFHSRCVCMELVTGVFKTTELYTGLPTTVTAIPVTLYQNTFYGFALKEIRGLFTKYSTTAVNPQQVVDWYKGYFFNHTYYLNPRSIMQCISRNGTFDSYHIPGDDVIGEFIDRILLSDEVQYELHFWISDKSRNYQRLIEYGDIDNDDTCWENFDKFKILFYAGYFYTTLTESGFHLNKPNNEIIHFLNLKTIQWVAGKFYSSVAEFYSFVGKLSAGKIEEFREKLRYFICNAADYLRNIRMNVASSFYHGFMIAVNHTLSSNNSIAAHGRNHEILVIVPKIDRGDIAIILKYATFDSETDLSSIVKKDLQGLNKQYKRDQFKSKNPHVKIRFKIAMAFCGEKFAIEFDKM